VIKVCVVINITFVLHISNNDEYLTKADPIHNIECLITTYTPLLILS